MLEVLGGIAGMLVLFLIVCFVEFLIESPIGGIVSIILIFFVVGAFLYSIFDP